MFRYTFTLLGLMLMAGFGMFFGIEIATRGIEQIQGPITGNSQPSHEVNAPVQHSGTTSVRNAPSATPSPTPMPNSSAASPTKGIGGAAASPTPTIPPIGSGTPSALGDSSVNRIGNGIGDLLQGAAHTTIRTVVGVFDGLIN